MRYAIGFLFVVTWTVSPSAGLDYASACTRPTRASRARALPSAPCDLGRYNYCTTPGDTYPWLSIRRFVKENQGLMRRMYGEERQISIIKAELGNYVEDEEEEDFDGKNNFAEDLMKTKIMYTKKNLGRAMRDKPHFRPISTEKNRRQDNDTLKVKPLESPTKLNNTDGANKTENNETLNEKGISYKTKLESIANIEINNLDPTVITLEAVIKESIETNSIYPKYTGNKVESSSTEVKNTTEKNITTTESISITETTTDSYDSTTESGKDLWRPMVAPSSDTSTLPPTLLFSEHEKVKVDRVDTKPLDKKEEFHPKPVQHQETMRPSVIKLRGANACESKEQIAAPFWANSTRGELLALLNMYPYEQYIHLETCVHEKKQMYCREGCRCEQQFRLHRLLAYDPRNECRGIFAEWFKFPSCCVCKCYDVPLEFRARSPRILPPQYGDRVKRIIYEDVARDWYSMSYDEEDDLY